MVIVIELGCYSGLCLGTQRQLYVMLEGMECNLRNSMGDCTLWASKKHFRHLERSYLVLLCSIDYNVIKWSHCELKRDLLYFLNICNGNIF